MYFNKKIILGSGSISSPDEETANLIKFFKENVNKLHALCQKFTTEGYLKIKYN